MLSYISASESDIDSILQLMRRYYAEDGYEFREDGSRKALTQLIGNDNLGSIWVLRDNDQVVGYLAVTLGFSLEYRGRDAFIDELYLAPYYRGKGFGTEAIKIAEQYCRDVGVKALHLEVEQHRENALELYRKQGFEDHNRYLMTEWISGKSL